MKYFLAFLSFIVPIVLLDAGCIEMNSAVFVALSLIVALFEMCYTYKQFHCANHRYDFGLSDAFWLSACVNAGVSLIFIGVATYCSCKWGDNFAAQSFAFAPLCLAFAYCCLLGAIICVLRLRNNWSMTITQRAQTWCFLGIAIFLMAAALYEIGVRYYGLLLPSYVNYVALALLYVCACGIIVCGYRTTILHKP